MDCIRLIIVNFILCFGPYVMPNFLVISSARSGSSLFANYLSSHHDVKYWGEILNTESSINPMVDSLNRDDLLSYVESIMVCRDAEWVGAKIHTHQLHELPISLSDILKGLNNPKILVIYRKSMLDTYVSLRIALKNNLWYSTAVVNSEQVHVDWSHFEKYAQRERSRWADCLGVLEALQCPTLVLSYERLIADTQRAMDVVFSFLGLNPVPVESESVRQNPSPVGEKISNWNELLLAKEGTERQFVLPDEWVGNTTHATLLT